MSSKIPWTRLFADKWAVVVDYLPPVEGNIYMRLRFRMLRTGEPLFCNIKVLSHYTGYSVKKFETALNVLLEEGYIIRLADGRLWNLDVEEELKNCNENLNKLSEKAIKAANTKRKKHKDDSSKDHDDVMMMSSRGHDDIMMKHINIDNNIYNKKPNTIVLAKKEIGSESLETNEQVHEPTEVAAVETTSEQITTGVDNQPPIHEQENVPKKAKRAKANRGCRLPDDFKPNLQYAIDKGLTHDEALLEVERFRNFWLAKSGANANKTDWPATWRNWIIHPEYGALSKKQTQTLRGYHGKFTQKTFTEQLAEGFNELRDHLSSGEDYGNDQSGVSIDAESWEYIDKTGGSANLRCLQSSTSVALCESFS
ncbi:hypothetical protein [Bartonella sp. SD1336NMGDW]|uniref:hypothetical protein n=1 Tax=Bartonella sp. SD1336NMGDW TaxID=3243575 RepID=UPI0035D07654